MTPTSSGRHCDACDRTVVDFEGMAEERARAWLALHGAARMCGRVRAEPHEASRDSHRPALADPKSVRSRGRDLRAAVAAVGVALAGCTGDAATKPPPKIAFTVDEAPEPSAKPPPEVVVNLPDPNLDTDGDGIPDMRDECPREPGTRKGCPGFVGLIVPDARIEFHDAIPFPSRASGFLPSAHPLLDEVAAVLRDHVEIAKVRVLGFVDATEGTVAKLGELRAQAVVDYLVSKGVDRARLVAVGLGVERPVDTSGTAEAQAKNRRVEFEIEGSR